MSAASYELDAFTQTGFASLFLIGIVITNSSLFSSGNITPLFTLFLFSMASQRPYTTGMYNVFLLVRENMSGKESNVINM